MAVHLATASDYLQRTTGIMPPSNTARTVMVWYRANAAFAGTNFTPFIDLDDPGVYTDYAALFEDATNVGLGIAGMTDITSAYSTGDWVHLCWVQSSTTTQRFYKNGVLIGSQTKNISAFTFGFELLGNDTFSASDVDLAYCRQWSAALNQSQIQSEMGSSQAVRTLNLWLDTPLISDLLDISGNGRNWTQIGSGTFSSTTSPLANNSSIQTATDMGTLPYTATVGSASLSAINLWYAYTAPSDTVYGFWGFSSLSDSLVTTIWLGPTSSPTVYQSITATNKPLQIPVTSGTTYYAQVSKTTIGLSADLSISALPAPTTAGLATPSIFVNDDTADFPLAILNSSGTVQRFVANFPAGELVAQLADGTILIPNSAGTALVIYDADLTVIATVVNPLSGTIAAVASDRDATFYVGFDQGATIQVTTISATGTVGGTTWTLSGTSLNAIAPSRDNTILYYANNGAAAPVKRWDLVNNTGLSDLVAGIALLFIGKDILVLSDGTVIVNYGSYAIAYDASGTLLHTYDASETTNRLAFSANDPTTFYRWLYLDDGGGPLNGVSRFDEVTTADGSTVLSTTSPQYEIGIYQPAATATPLARFGHSFSCPFWLSMVSTPVTPSEPVEYLIRRERWFPVLSHEQFRQFFSMLQIDLQAGNGLGNVDSTTGGFNPLMEIDWSDDGGWTWSSLRFAESGKIGAYEWRTIVRRLGYGRNRVFRIAVTDPNQWVIINGYLQAVLGSS